MSTGLFPNVNNSPTSPHSPQALASEYARQTQPTEAIAGIGKQLQSLDSEARSKTLSEIQDAQRQSMVQELSMLWSRL